MVPLYSGDAVYGAIVACSNSASLRCRRSRVARGGRPPRFAGARSRGKLRPRTPPHSNLAARDASPVARESRRRDAQRDLSSRILGGASRRRLVRRLRPRRASRAASASATSPVRPRGLRGDGQAAPLDQRRCDVRTQSRRESSTPPSEFCYGAFRLPSRRRSSRSSIPRTARRWPMPTRGIRTRSSVNATARSRSWQPTAFRSGCVQRGEPANPVVERLRRTRRCLAFYSDGLTEATHDTLARRTPLHEAVGSQAMLYVENPARFIEEYCLRESVARRRRDPCGQLPVVPALEV